MKLEELEDKSLATIERLKAAIFNKDADEIDRLWSNLDALLVDLDHALTESSND